MAVFVCPKCQHVQAVDDKHIARLATCPKCKAQGVVEHGIPTGGIRPPDAPPAQRLCHATGGYLGIRCDTWVAADRHLNKRSSLRVEWSTVIDDTLPIKFVEPCGLLIHNTSSDYPLDLCYRASAVVACLMEATTAIEVRYMSFNVWGEHVNTVRASEVFDLQVGQKIRLNHSWHLYSEAEADEFCGSMAFVSRVKLASGTVLNADLGFVLREVQRIAEKCTEANLEPKAPSRTQ